MTEVLLTSRADIWPNPSGKKIIVNQCISTKTWIFHSPVSYQIAELPSKVILINLPPQGQRQWDRVPAASCGPLVPWPCRSLAISQPWTDRSCGRRWNHSSTPAGRSIHAVTNAWQRSPQSWEPEIAAPGEWHHCQK